MTIVAIIGSRDFMDADYLSECMGELPRNIHKVVSGGAAGADTIGVLWAASKDIKFDEFIPDYDKYGKAAPFVRNRQIIEACDVVVAFWDGKSTGTAHALGEAFKLRKEVHVFMDWEPEAPAQLDLEGL